MMPVHNVAPFLRTCLRSVLAQTFKDFEIVAIDDGSTDGSWEILHAQPHPALRIERQENQGIARTRNTILERARGRYIAVMDPDDVAFPDRLARQVEFLEANPDCAIVSGQVVEIDEIGRILSACRTTPARPSFDRATLAAKPNQMLCWHSAAMLRASAVRAIGGYDEAFRNYAEDLDLFERIAATSRIANLNAPMIYYRIRRSSAITRYRELNSLHRQAAHGAAADSSAGARDRAQADLRRRVDEHERRLTAARLERSYQNRIGWAALRGEQWALARAAFFRSASPPLLLPSLKGIVKACLGTIGLLAKWHPVERLEGSRDQFRSYLEELG